MSSSKAWGHEILGTAIGLGVVDCMALAKPFMEPLAQARTETFMPWRSWFPK